MMTIELSKQERGEAIVSMKRNFDEGMPEPLGDLAAGLLLDFFQEEVGPMIYNQAVADAQIQLRVSDLSVS